MSDLTGKTLFITGASRGIGKAIGLRAARDGANIVIAAKTVEPHPKLNGTIYTGAAEMEAAGGKALACPALWPRTVIATAAVMNLLGGESTMNRARKPEIMADAAYAILTRPSRECTGNFFIDEEVLRATGVSDFSQYAFRPGAELMN